MPEGRFRACSAVRSPSVVHQVLRRRVIIFLWRRCLAGQHRQTASQETCCPLPRRAFLEEPRRESGVHRLLHSQLILHLEGHR